MYLATVADYLFALLVGQKKQRKKDFLEQTAFEQLQHFDKGGQWRLALGTNATRHTSGCATLPLAPLLLPCFLIRCWS